MPTFLQTTHKMQAQIPLTVRSSKYKKSGVSPAGQLFSKRVILWHLFTGLTKLKKKPGYLLL
jgi:hypothetical protein